MKRLEFRTVPEFRKLLVDRQDQFNRCLTEKLMTYALGRELEVGDRPSVDEILAELDGKKSGLRDLMRLVVLSKPFQLDELRQSDMFAPVRVADYLIDKDRIFAELTLDGEELALYDQICEKLDIVAPVPDLVVYLQASVDTLLSRIARRGISYERLIDRAYLEKLNDAYARHFYSYDEAPLLIVNASGIDLVNNDSDYERLLQQIQRTSGGRHFFNPAAVALA